MDDPSLSDEILLTGGRLTPGVVKVGNTVRRPLQKSSPFVASLLKHLEAVEFSGSPRHLGQDQDGREILSYIEGWVPSKFQRFTDQQVFEVGLLLRKFHTATMECGLTDQNSVICHHDAGPNNTVFQDGRPIALIDFDMAAPGEPIEDLGYAAWTWSVSSKPDRGPASEQASQVRVLSDSYGLNRVERLEIVDSMIERQQRNIEFWQNYNGTTATKEQIKDCITWSEKEMEYTRANKKVFLKALS